MEQLNSIQSLFPPEETVSQCIKKHCKDFLLYTNWKVLIPHLMANELLDSHISEVLMSNYRTDHEKGLEFYVKVLPSKGNTAYSRFYDCIAKENEHIGHRTLLELMNSYYFENPIPS